MAEKEVALTKAGHQKLKEELDYLINKKRREVGRRIKEAIEFGDISENSEYDDAKNEQAFVEGRINQITNIIRNAKLIENSGRTDKVDLGSVVVLRDLESDEVIEYMLVGSAEADPSECRISNESPVGMAIIGKKPGDKLKVQVPVGELEYLILDIK
ncbi:MAG TPA: transcription elongation factor GreA [Actinobacteria bacterium]|nr:transcription elongation factor GreA [Actinomycetota bacterium]